MPEQTPVQPEGQAPPVKKIEFSPEMQVKIDSLIREAMGRAGREAREQAAKLQEEKDAAIAAAEVLKSELATLRGDKSGLEKESKTVKQELAKVKKQNAIQDAASKHGFVDVGQVSKLVGDEIVYDSTKNQFHVVDEHGTVRTGLDGSTPLTLDSFFQDFANRNGHLVRGTVKPGVGSSTDARPYSPQTDAQKLKAIFGKGSSSKAANDMAMQNPQLYKQMRREARALGIIP
jgi:hypothetical protein